MNVVGYHGIIKYLFEDLMYPQTWDGNGYADLISIKDFNKKSTVDNDIYSGWRYIPKNTWNKESFAIRGE